MADHPAVRQSGTQALVADTVDRVLFDADCNVIEVWADGPLTFSLHGEDPVAGDPECYDLPVAGARQVNVPTAGDTEVRLIAEADCNYLVTRIS